ncbi:hypothetical protein CE91St19_29960 [Odoribacter laneus]|jgi:lipoprotein|uniref:PQQ-like beta-propeller repeat protein n=1 Tax=Odoribacter laneus TaxID=626933 RepID=UPI00189ABBAD|nr:PQQ-like beta-propeller repeat protein [Odoribacter laneus]GKI23594.1 hypothetical protein CE91St19_29960 [Odoribacter laneus]GKI26827.1 hypothetical protein CE91St20_29640 [Odoribacter laneus]
MKQLILFALCLLIIACQDPFLIGNEYTQSELISTISKGRKCVWIGSETGAIFAFDPETERFTSPQWIETERIYAITEVADSLLLVGIRNEGLKLITFDQGILKTIKSYQIEKGDRFSPYSFIVKQGPAGIDTLLCASSNGLFYTVFLRNKLLQPEIVQLTSLYPSKGQSPDYKFYSVVENRESGELFTAGNKGLLRIKGLTPLQIEIVKGEVFSHLSYSDNVTYALSEQGELYGGNEMSHLIFSFTTSPVLCYYDACKFWGFSENKVEICHSMGGSRTYRLTHPLSVGKNNPRGRGAVAMDENFFYVATGRALQRFPRGTYPTEKQRITSLCKNEDGHTVYAVNEQNELYGIDLQKNNIRYIKQLNAGNGQNVRKLLGVVGNKLYFYTVDGIYQTLLNSWSGCSEMFCPVTGKELQQAEFNVSNKQIIYAYTDSIYSYNIASQSFVTLTPVPDFYTSAIAMSSNGSTAFIGTLNNGIYMTTDFRSPLKHVCSIGSNNVRDITCIDDERLYVLTPSKIYLLEKQGGEYLIKDSVAASRNAIKLIPTNRYLFTLSVTGGIDSYHTATLQPIRRYRENILFEKNGVLTYKDSLVLASNNGLAMYQANTSDVLVWKSLPYPSLWQRVVYWRFPVGLLLLLLVAIIAIFLTVELYRAQKRKKQLQLLIRQHDKERSRKKATMIFKQQEKELSTASLLHAIVYADVLHQECILLFKNEQSPVESLEKANQKIQQWLGLYAQYQEIEEWVHKLKKPYERLMQETAYKDMKPVITIHEWTKAIGNNLAAFCHYKNFETWIAKIQELREQFEQLEKDAPLLKEELGNCIECIFHSLWPDSHIAKEVQGYGMKAIHALKDAKDIEALGCMGNFMTQLSALPILQQVSGLLQQIALIPAKAKTGFLDGNLGEKENVYKTLFGIRVSFEAIVKEFYKQQSDKEMLCLKQSLGISQKSSHKALLFVALLFGEEARENIYLLHGDVGINRQETTNSRKNEIKRSLYELNLSDYGNKLSFMCILIQILHKQMIHDSL